MEISESLQAYFKHKGLSQVEIAKQLGVSKTYVNALFAGRQRFGKKQAEIWEDLFGLSKSWLLTGQGEMLKKVEQPNIMSIKDRINEFIAAQGIKRSVFEKSCGFSNGYTRNLKENPSATKIEDILNAYPKLNRVWLLSGEGEMLKKAEVLSETEDSLGVNQEIPQGSYREDEVPDRYISYLVPMSAMGGSLSGFDMEGVRREDCEKVVSPVANTDWVVPVCGDSMEPEYPNGSRVYVRKINPNDFIEWGNVYVLDTTNGLIIKVIMKSEKPDCIQCVSLNPSGRYAPFDVPFRAIRDMYRVMLCASVK